MNLLSARNARKDDWIDLATKYNVQIRPSWKKDKIKNVVLNDLVMKEILEEEALNLCESEPKESMALMELRLRYQREEKEMEREREREREEKRERERK